MENKTFFIVLIVAVMLSVPVAFLIHNIIFIDDIYEYDMYLTVEDRSGVNVASDAIYFGTVKPGDTVTKKIGVMVPGPREIVVKTKSNFEDWLSYATPVVVDVNGMNLSISVVVPKNATFGEYSGKMKVIVYK